MDNSSVTSQVSLSLEMQVVLADQSRVAIPVQLSYDAEDAYAIGASFQTGDDEVTWVFARDLLRDGLTGPVGEGDIKIRPAHPSRGPVVLLTLSSPGGSAQLEADRNLLRNFVSQVYDAVPAGDEWQYLKLDQAIGELLAWG